MEMLVYYRVQEFYFTLLFLAFSQILLHTMHKYMMKIIVDHSNGTNRTVIPLPDTTFIAVSAYQNVELTQLKIDNNPFAKGFRYKIRAAAGTPTPPNTIKVAMSTASSQPPAPAPPLPSGEGHVLTYWQQLQMQGMIPQCEFRFKQMEFCLTSSVFFSFFFSALVDNPILQMTPPTSTLAPTSSSTPSSSSANKTSSPSDVVASSETTRSPPATTLPIHPTLPTIPAGIAPHFPVFYHHHHHPFMPSPYHLSIQTSEAPVAPVEKRE